MTSDLSQGNRVTVTDPAGKWKAFTSDVEGNLGTVTEPVGNTTYMYSDLGQLLTVTMVRGGVTPTRTWTGMSVDRAEREEC